MPALTFRGVTKRFGDTEVIRDFTAGVADKEFLVLLGPSGCGKSTMLRMIAGLTEITGGDIFFDDVKVNELEPRERNVAFVFQSYALYPHMTVRGNIAFPLIMDRFKSWYHIPIVNTIARRTLQRSPDIRERVERVAEMLELTDYLERRPRTLSGGQRQRVAVARALVRDPEIYLLDEPLSNLDAKLRNQMRAEISALYQRVGKTFIYVTHDQVEALTMGTRIIILNAGQVQQYGTAEEIYGRPANTFVARFVGSPPMNLVPVRLSGGAVTVTQEAAAGLSVEGVHVALPDGDYQMGIRPEVMSVTTGAESSVADVNLAARVRLVEHLGGESVVGFRLGTVDEGGALGAAASRDLHFVKVPGATAITPGQACRVGFSLADVSWFDSSTTARVEVGAGARA